MQHRSRKNTAVKTPPYTDNDKSLHSAARSRQHSPECKDPRRQCFVTCELDLWPFYPPPKAFLGLVAKRFCIKFGDPLAASVLALSCRKTHTDKRRWKPQPPASAVCTGSEWINETEFWNYKALHRHCANSRGKSPASQLGGPVIN